MCRPKSNNLAVTQVNDFEARAFGELSRAVVERHQEQAAEVAPIPLLWRGARQGGVVEPRLPAAGRSGTSAREKSGMDLFRASLSTGPEPASG